MNVRAQSGIALIELTMVMLILALAAVPLLGQFTQVAGSGRLNEAIQTAAQLAQERAESILAIRREQGYASLALGTGNETLTGRFAGYSRRTEVTEASMSEDCPPSASCKRVLIEVSRGTDSRSELMTVLIDY